MFGTVYLEFLLVVLFVNVVPHGDIDDAFVIVEKSDQLVQCRRFLVETFDVDGLGNQLLLALFCPFRQGMVRGPGEKT